MAHDMTSFLVAHLEARGLRVTGAESSGANMLTECFNGHGRRTPCLSIRKSDGAFFCFSCNAKGRDWKVLVKALGGDLPDEEEPDPFSILAAQLKSEHDKQERVVAALPPDLAPWDSGRYRGLTPAFLRRVKAQRWYDYLDRVDRILFPIEQDQQLMGWVARRLDKKKLRKYRNMTGMKSADILYPFDLVSKVLRTGVVVLVEGPMDALRLCCLRIPALAIMGTNNWRDHNRNLLLRLGVHTVIICTDGDSKGIECRYETLEPSLENRFGLEHFLPPKGSDPGAMSMKYCMRLKGMANRLAAA